MKKTISAKTLCASVMLVLAFAVWAVPAAATAPTDVTIVSLMYLPEHTGTFDASGPAVDAGILCPSGDVVDTELRVAKQNDRVFIIFVHKLFTCADGSGTFEMDLNVQILGIPPVSQATWRVVAGNDAYARLRGQGKLTTESAGDDDVIDTYTGGLHIN